MLQHLCFNGFKQVRRSEGWFAAFEARSAWRFHEGISREAKWKNHGQGAQSVVVTWC